MLRRDNVILCLNRISASRWVVCESSANGMEAEADLACHYRYNSVFRFMSVDMEEIPHSAHQQDAQPTTEQQRGGGVGQHSTARCAQWALLTALQGDEAGGALWLQVRCVTWWGGGEGRAPCHAEHFHAKLSTNQHISQPTCPPSPTNGLALSTCLSVNQPIRPQSEDTAEEEAAQIDGGTTGKILHLDHNWDLLRVLLGVLEAEERVEPALLAREMGRGTGVTGGESS
ncbi:hypothetical protein INR49_028720 [Caranx melampygus]|nr:hypothetical protein INR49_028720 [Caranx melampygus]